MITILQRLRFLRSLITLSLTLHCGGWTVDAIHGQSSNKADRTLQHRSGTGGVVHATVETSLTTETDHIRQFAFDGDADTYFASAENADPVDYFAILFDRPVAVQSVSVTTGRPGGKDLLEAGILQATADGKRFVELAKFTKGTAQVKPEAQRIRGIRIKPVAALNHSLVIREITVESEPKITAFKYPVEFVVSVTDAPEMKDWADKVANICARAYPIINDELQSEGFKPAHLIRLTLKKDYRGVAYTAGTNIVGSANFFKQHPNDVGAFVHETVHVVQRYRGDKPGWLVEGIADYIRFFKFEPRKLGRIDPNRAHYNSSYRMSAAFLAFLCSRYDPLLVRKLNKVLREGSYSPKFFEERTGRTLQELDREWLSTLTPRP